MKTKAEISDEEKLAIKDLIIHSIVKELALKKRINQICIKLKVDTKLKIDEKINHLVVNVDRFKTMQNDKRLKSKIQSYDIRDREEYRRVQLLQLEKLIRSDSRFNGVTPGGLKGATT